MPEQHPASIVHYDGQAYERRSGESVLDCLLRHGVRAPHSCKRATCHSCMMKATAGAVPARAQDPLPPVARQLGFFLACVCFPEQSISAISAREHQQFRQATVIGKHWLAPRICQLRLRPAQALHWRPGQFINLRRPDGAVRSYSLASHPAADTALELHVQDSGGDFVSWLLENVAPGDEVEFQGPNGQCIYLPGAADAPMLLVGTGSGLAPLLGIIRDALQQGHRGGIHLYHGSRFAAGLYYQTALRELAQRHPNLYYHPCLSGEQAQDARHGRAEVCALADHPDLSGWRVYLCGHPQMVRATQNAVVQRGARRSDVRADPFD